MEKYNVVILTRPKEGRDEEFNKWYTETHIDDVLEVPGFTAAQRFKMSGEPLTPNAWQYYTLYEIEHDDPQSVIAEMMSRVGSERMPMSDSVSEDLYCVIYKAMMPRKVATTKT